MSMQYNELNFWSTSYIYREEAVRWETTPKRQLDPLEAEANFLSARLSIPDEDLLTAKGDNDSFLDNISEIEVHTHITVCTHLCGTLVACMDTLVACMDTLAFLSESRSYLERTDLEASLFPNRILPDKRQGGYTKIDIANSIAAGRGSP